MTKFNFTFLLAFLFCCGMLQAQGSFFSEDFDGGLPADWTAIEVVGDGGTASNWMHTTTGPGGAFATPPIASTTASNGWMIFDSDLNCSGAQDAYLVSPALDGSDKNVVFVEFESYYRSFNDAVSIQVTTDLSLPYTEWSEFLIYPTIGATDVAAGGANPDLVTINITSAAAGQPVFYVAFRFLADASTQNGGNGDGCAYNWQIDDVAVTDADPRPANDLMVNSFFAIPPNFATPASQVESFGFMADIENGGSSAQTGANLNVTIENSSNSMEVFNTDLAYPEFAVDQLIENVFVPEAYTPAAETGVFSGAYTLTLDGQTDDVPENNTRTFDFVVTDTLFSKGNTPTTATRAAADESYSWGNIYYVPNGAGYYARYMSFGYSNAADAAGESVTTFLFKWDGDTNEDGIANEDEYGAAPIAFNSYTFTGNEPANTIITLPVDLDGNAIELEDDSYYMVVTRFDTDVATELFQLATDDIDYFAMQFMSDSLGMPRYAGALDVGNTNEYSLTGFGFDIQPYVTLSVSDNPSLTKTSNILSAANRIEIAPNPVSDEFRLDLDFVSTAENVTIEIYDVMGRTLKTEQFTKLRTQSMTYDVRQWQSGTYFLRVTTEEGIRTKRVIVK